MWSSVGLCCLKSMRGTSNICLATCDEKSMMHMSLGVPLSNPNPPPSPFLVFSKKPIPDTWTKELARKGENYFFCTGTTIKRMQSNIRNLQRQSSHMEDLHWPTLCSTNTPFPRPCQTQLIGLKSWRVSKMVFSFDGQWKTAFKILDFQFYSLWGFTREVWWFCMQSFRRFD